MANNRQRREKSTAQSIRNNLYSIADNKYNAQKAKFFINRLKSMTSFTEQKLIVDLILAGFEVAPFAADFRETIRMEWSIDHKDATNELF